MKPLHSHIWPQESFRNLLEQECRRSERYLQFFSVVRIDWQSLDLEDIQLFDVADLISEVIRNSDILGFSQDKDLAVILPQAEALDTQAIVSRIRERLCRYLEQKLKNQAVGIQWACFPTHAATADGLIGAL